MIFEQRISERAFPNWDMRFFYVEKIDIETINKILRFRNGIGEDSVSREKLFELFEIFLEEAGFKNVKITPSPCYFAIVYGEK